ncbi:DUF4167 domain-containing protein [Planktotalea sp.]|uniref:DUF4167 domain-containing protein n=1 Tax=Planktotalea sp. TaxID=2029877 RepID=UPI0025FF639E|nr:DUF4167 domain-containing protein [Planktotalea sp.]
MRSSKPRSRKNNNRNRQPNQGGGNIPNRVFDSSGPEGKVRGTPQQIIDKYQQLARDAQLSGDRVATENFSQHAEHYLRMLGAAQKEIDERREVQERENRERQAERDRERAERDAERAEREAAQAAQAPVVADAPVGSGDQPGLIEAAPAFESGLVETPESKPRPPRKPRGPRKAPEGKQAAAVDAAPAPVQATDVSE